MDMSANSMMDIVKDGEKVLVYCKKCKTELELDQVIEHMAVRDQFPDWHIVHFTIEKE